MLHARGIIVSFHFGLGIAELGGAVFGTECHTVKITPCEARPPYYFGSRNVLTADGLISGYAGDDWADPNDSTCESGAVDVFVPVAGEWFREAKITPSDGTCDDNFGGSLDWDGTRLIVGAQNRGYDNRPPRNAGGAYVYRLDGGWMLEGKLPYPSDAGLDDYFGVSVAVDGDWAAVGAPANDAGPGAVYVFRWAGSQWVQHVKLTADDWMLGDAGLGDRFGWSVSISSDVLAVGAFRDNENGFWAGAAYVFRLQSETSWVAEAKLMAAEPAGLGENYFAAGLDIQGNLLIVGAPFYHTASQPGAAGVVYVYRNNGGAWVYQARLTDPTATAREEFGTRVQVDGNRIVAGGDQKDWPVLNGTVIVFALDGSGHWNLELEIRDPDGNRGAAWGNGVALRGDLVAAGAPTGTGGMGLTPGVVHVLDLSGSRCDETPPPCCPDGDGDGYGSPGHWSCPAGEELDCNDHDSAIHPGQVVDTCDGEDNDCDGTTDEDFVSQMTSCGLGQCARAGMLTCVNGNVHDNCSPESPSPEICDGVDNDCDSTTDNAPVPQAFDTLRVDQQFGATLLHWMPVAGATHYDVVFGRISVLEITDGDFSYATEGCLANDSIETSFVTTAAPPPGDAYWYLVRGGNCGGTGTYDTGLPDQVGLRDQEIMESNRACESD